MMFWSVHRPIIFLCYLLMIKSHSTGTEKTESMTCCLPQFFISYLMKALYHITNAGFPVHWCLSAFNLWVLDSQCDDLAVTGDSAAKAATFHLLCKWISQRSSIPIPWSKQSPRTGFLGQCLFRVWIPPRKAHTTSLGSLCQGFIFLTVKEVLSHI